jgi:hypothetical protein
MFGYDFTKNDMTPAQRYQDDIETIRARGREKRRKEEELDYYFRLLHGPCISCGIKHGGACASDGSSRN